jgi:phi13 family phage major tail protein
MSKIGTPFDLRNIWYAKRTYSNGVATLSGGRQLGLAMKATITPSVKQFPLYAESRKSENRTLFVDGAVVLGVKSIETQVKVDLFGNTATGDAVVGSGNDNPNYVAIAFYVPAMEDGVTKYQCFSLNKAQFYNPPSSFQTAGDSISWVTPELTGTFMADEDGNWFKEDVKDNEQDAMEWVYTTLNIAYCETPTATPAAGSVASGTEITLATTTSGATIYYTTDGSTPSASSTAYSADDKPEITAATTIKAIAIKTGSVSSPVLTAAYTLN